MPSRPAGSWEDDKVKATILVTIDGEQVQCSLNCTHEAQEALAPVLCKIRRLVEEHLESIGAEGLLACVNDYG